MNNIKLFSILTSLVILSMGCSSVDKKEKTSYSDDINQLERDQVEFSRYFSEIDQKIQEVVDPQINQYLVSVAQKIKIQTRFFQQSDVRVILHHNALGANKNFAIPGVRIYISLELLRKFKFESELAAFMALQFAYLETQSFSLEEFQKLNINDQLVDYIIKQTQSEESLQAVPVAIKILYQSKYDPRSLDGLWEHYKYLKYIDHLKLQSLQSASFREMSFYAPIKNPIVQTLSFNNFKKRLEKI